MIKFLWRFGQFPFFLISFLKNRSTLIKIKQNDVRDSDKLYSAILRTLKNDVSDEENIKIELVEKIRNHWGESDQNITVLNNPHKYENVNRLAKISSKPKFWCTLIFNLIREFKPVNCLEMGTCIGISALYQASALKLNGVGNLITLEGHPERAKIAEENFRSADLQNIYLKIGEFDNVLPTVLNENMKFDFLFIDGNHNYKSTLNYFQTILPHLSDNAIVIIDDNFHSPEMNKAWNELIEDINVISTVNLFVLGILIINKKGKQKSHYSIATFNF